MRRTAFSTAAQLRKLTTFADSQAEPLAAAVVPLSHTGEEDLKAIPAYERPRAGGRYSDRLRKEGKTPAVLYSLPGNKSKLISVDSKDITRLVQLQGRTRLQSQLYQLEIHSQHGQTPELFRVLVRMVHRNSKTDVVENITFMYCPPGRRVEVPVPIDLYLEEFSPAVKRGGYVNRIRKVINCSCPGDMIPTSIEVDCTSLDTDARVMLSDLKMPPGVRLLEKVTVNNVVTEFKAHGSITELLAPG